MKIKTILVLALLYAYPAFSQKQPAYNAIYSGVPWYDNNGNIISAHGGCIVKDNGRYYFFGEKHTDTSNAFAGFNCYSSTDLYNWKFEAIALPVQDTGKLTAMHVGERVKVMRCPKTGEYVMYMHADTLTYKDQFVGYATASNITGPYTWQGPLLFKGKPVHKWDMGSFQDKDGAGYILIHGGELYQLADDYKSITEQVHQAMGPGFESPTLLRRGNMYYWLGSNLTSWERNDNYYYTATSLKGPWTSRGLFAPAGTLTWNSQCTFVLPIEGTADTSYLFMGDRWAFPKQASAATYVWQPLVFNDSTMSLPEYKEAWQLDTKTGTVKTLPVAGKIIVHTGEKQIAYSGSWQHGQAGSRAGEKDAAFTVKFKGTQIGWYGMAQQDGGYARIMLTNNKGKTLFTGIVDTYSKSAVSGLRFISPVLQQDNYTLTIAVMGERGNWSDKRKNNYGSTGNFISVEKIIVAK